MKNGSVEQKPAQRRRLGDDPGGDPWFALTGKVGRKNLLSRQPTACYCEQTGLYKPASLGTGQLEK